MISNTLETRRGIPPLSFYNNPIHIYLRLRLNGGKYEAELQAGGRQIRVPIDISPHDLAAICKRLKGVMEQTAKISLKGNYKNPGEQDSNLRSLATEGKYAFERVFSHHDLNTVIHKMLSDYKILYFEIASEDFSIPWELLYTGDLEELIMPNNFLGMKHIIQRTIVQYNRPGDFVPPTIHYNSSPKLGLICLNHLPSVKNGEVPFFEALNKKGVIELSTLKDLNPELKQQGITDFKEFFGESFDLAHFACHAEWIESEPEESCFIVTDEFPISLQDITLCNLNINGHPLVIINACETGRLNPLYSLHFASIFLRYGARGVVAAECAVPDKFAALFIKHLYLCLLKGQSLGVSLLNTRKYFMERESNPTGLSYSMYATPSITLMKKGD